MVRFICTQCFSLKTGDETMKRAIGFSILFVIASFGQTSPKTLPPATAGQPPAKTTIVTKPQVAPAPKPAELTVEQVVQLVQAGLSDDLVIAKIKKNNKAFDLSTDELLKLKAAKVSENIIMLLMDPTAQPKVAPPPPPPPAPATLPTSIPEQDKAVTTGEPKTAFQKTVETQQTNTTVPEEQGLYWLKGGKELVRIEGSAVSNVRTGSTLVSGLTAGIKKAKMNAQLKGARSEFRMKERQPQFYFYLPENASVVDFLLLKIGQRLDVRQIEIGEKTFWKLQAGVDHTAQVEFTYKRIKNRLYLVTPNHELEPGEYGFYSMGVSAVELKNSRVYDFGIDP
jgi:hypothetical protein